MLCRDPDKSHKMCIGDCAERCKRTGVIMNDCKWTAGPWYINNGENHKYLKGMITVIDKNDGEETVICGNISEYYGVSEAKANAQLIAAAPTMATFIQGLINDGLLDLGWREDAEEIMAKARGEQA